MLGAQVMEPLQDFVAALIGFIPVLLIATLVMVIGIILSIAISKLIASLARGVGVDKLFGDLGADSLLKKAGYRRSTSRLIEMVVRWTGYLLTTVVASKLIGFDELARGLTSVIAYLPRLIVALLFVVVGVWAGTLLRRLIVSSSESDTGIESTRLIGIVAQYGVIIVAVAIAADQLGFRTGVINGMLLILCGSLGLAAAITLGLGGRETARNYVARNFVAKQYARGDYITVKDEFSGIIKGHTATNLVVRTKDGEITVPYHLLMNEIVWLDSSSSMSSVPERNTAANEAIDDELNESTDDSK